MTRALRAFHCAGVIQSIWGLYRSPEEISQLFNWKKNKDWDRLQVMLPYLQSPSPELHEPMKAEKMVKE